MININENFLELQASYLFSDIAKKVAEFQKNNPEKRVIKLGIGDVTRPIVPACVEAMHKAVDEVATKEGFKGYGPEQGYEFLRKAISKEYKERGIDINLDEVNELNYVHMGSYGIGLDRCISAIVEKHNDEKGIIWPMEVAPYKVGIVIINVNDKETYKYASNLYKKLEQIGIDTILDDRKETVGIKFNDMDLMGIPIRITIGRKLEEGMVEFKLRDEEQSHDIDRDIIIKTILETIASKSKIKTYN